MADTSTVAYTGRHGVPILVPWLIEAGMADTGTVAYTGRYG